MRLNKELYLAKIAPSLVRGVTFPDHATIVDHTIIRGRVLAKTLDEKGLFC